MGNITLALPSSLQERMRKHKEIRWSAVARQAIEEKLMALDQMDKIANNSKLTTADIEKLARMINKETFKELDKRFSST